MLVAVGLAGNSIPAAARKRALRFAAPLILIFGVLTLARGGALSKGALPACCDQDGSSGPASETRDTQPSIEE